MATKVAFIPPRRIQWYNTTGGSHRASSGTSPPSPFTGYQIDPRTGALVPPPRDGQWECDRDIHLNKFAIKIFILHRRDDRLDLNQGQDRALARVLEAISAPMIPREDGSPKLLPMWNLTNSSLAMRHQHIDPSKDNLDCFQHDRRCAIQPTTDYPPSPIPGGIRNVLPHLEKPCHL